MPYNDKIRELHFPGEINTYIFTIDPSRYLVTRRCASQPAIIGPSRHCSLVGSSLQRGIARTGAARSSDKADAIASVVTLPSRSRRAANVLQGDPLCFRAKMAAA